MRKWIFLFLAVAAVFIYFYSCMAYWLLKPSFSTIKMDNISFREAPSGELADALAKLRSRDDQAARSGIEKALKVSGNGIETLWANAELLRRKGDYADSEDKLKNILSVHPTHVLSMVSLAYIKYKSGKFDEAESLISRALDLSNDKDSAAAAYVVLGALNAARARSGNILDKLRYGPQVKCYFDKAAELAPSLAEPHLALGTFYLFAPALLGGGNLNKALVELDLAVKLAPDFATANARLAQCYKKRYDYVKYSLYNEAAQKLQEDNEALKEPGAW